MRIGIIGHFGGKNTYHDGQTVKTVTLYDAMLRRKPKEIGIDKIDTYYIKHHPLIFIWQMVKSICKDKKWVVLLSDRGRTVLFPLLYVFAKILRKEIYHYGIGGKLANEVRAKRNWKKFVLSFQANWVESKSAALQLNEMGVNNAKYLPNFKNLTILDKNSLPSEYHSPFRFCLFSRVMKEKGVEDAINAIVAINRKYGNVVAELDIYGPVEHDYQNQFDKCVEAAKEYCKYCGIVPAAKSVETLKGYFMLLFPTFFKFEGLPGTIIDALSAGLPIIARRWAYCDEIIDDHKTGLVYDFEKPELLVERIAFAIEHCDSIIEMKPNCIEAANRYSEETVMAQIGKEMGVSFRRAE